MILGYWNLKARAEATRILLAHTKQDYKEENPQSFEEWGKQKSAMDFDFPNLPYLKDGDLKLTNSKVIFRYIAERSGDNSLLGNNPKERARISMFTDVLEELFTINFKTIGSDDALKTYQGLLDKTIVPFLTQLEKVASDDSFLLGNLTVCDFKLYIAREIIGIWSDALKIDDPFNKCKKLLAVVDRFKQLPEIKKYLASDNAKRPFVVPFVLPKLK